MAAAMEGAPIKLKPNRLLGQGAFATVHKTHHPSLGVIAVKVLRPEYASTHEAVRILLREAALAASLNHSHIVRCRAVCQAAVGPNPPSQALIMEYMESGSLAELLSKQMKQPREQMYTEAEGLTWMLQIADALSYLHRREPAIIHRDVKPANVLLAPTPGAGGGRAATSSFRIQFGGSGAPKFPRLTAKLCDFGLHVVVKPADHRPLLRINSRVARASASGVFQHARVSSDGSLVLPSLLLKTCGRPGASGSAAAAITSGGGGVGPMGPCCFGPLDSAMLSSIESGGGNLGHDIVRQLAGPSGLTSSLIITSATLLEVPPVPLPVPLPFTALQQLPALPYGVAGVAATAAACGDRAAAFGAEAGVAASGGRFGRTRSANAVSASATAAAAAALAAAAASYTSQVQQTRLANSALPLPSPSPSLPLSPPANWQQGADLLPPRPATSTHFGEALASTASPTGRLQGWLKRHVHGREGANQKLDFMGGSLHRSRATDGGGATAAPATLQVSRLASGGSVLTATGPRPDAVAAATAAAAADAVVRDACHAPMRRARRAYSFGVSAAAVGRNGSSCGGGGGGAGGGGDGGSDGGAVSTAGSCAISVDLRLESSLLERVFPFSGQCGSTIYMSPEVAQEQPYNEKADVFSFGVMLFEVVSRKLISQTQGGRCGHAFTRMVVEGKRPGLPPSLDPRVAALIRACWHSDPLERPGMNQVVGVLQDVLHGSHGLPAVPGSPRGASPVTSSASCTASNSLVPAIASSQEDGSIAVRYGSVVDAAGGRCGGGFGGVSRLGAAAAAAAAADAHSSQSTETALSREPSTSMSHSKQPTRLLLSMNIPASTSAVNGAAGGSFEVSSSTEPWHPTSPAGASSNVCERRSQGITPQLLPPQKQQQQKQHLQEGPLEPSATQSPYVMAGSAAGSVGQVHCESPSRGTPFLRCAEGESLAEAAGDGGVALTHGSPASPSQTAATAAASSQRGILPRREAHLEECTRQVAAAAAAAAALTGAAAATTCTVTVDATAVTHETNGSTAAVLSASSGSKAAPDPSTHPSTSERPGGGAAGTPLVLHVDALGPARPGATCVADGGGGTDGTAAGAVSEYNAAKAPPLTPLPPTPLPRAAVAASSGTMSAAVAAPVRAAAPSRARRRDDVSRQGDGPSGAASNAKQPAPQCCVIS